MLARHPANPARPYLPWQRKVRAQLEALQQVPSPDIHTRSLIQALEQRLETPLPKQQRKKR